MITIQSTFKYLGDVKEAPFQNIEISVLFPIFDYTGPSEETGNLQITRHIASVDKQDLALALNSVTYRASLPSSDLTGSGVPLIANFLNYTVHAIRAESLTDLSFDIPIRFRVGNTAQAVPLGGEGFQALYLVRNISHLFDPLQMPGAVHIPSVVSKVELAWSERRLSSKAPYSCSTEVFTQIFFLSSNDSPTRRAIGRS